jgi:hypothetical protein
MSDNAWAITGFFACISVFAFMCFLAACASGKREDDAANQLSDGECAAEWRQETAVHGQPNITGAPRDHV